VQAQEYDSVPNMDALQKRRVLVVDDNANHLRSLSRRLTRWGLISIGRTSGLETLENLELNSYDLAIIDTRMADMDGWTLAATIRNSMDSRSIPLILLSGPDETPALRPTYVPGTMTVLAKPVVEQQLLAALLNSFSPGLTARANGATPFDSGLATRIPLSILLAEDNTVNQKVAVKLLNRLGYEVDVASGGYEVLSAISHRIYDLILMDVQMPDMDGLETTRQLRGQLSAADQPYVIALTASTTLEDREACLAVGMDDYIGKPMRLDSLVGALKRIPENRRTHTGSDH